MENRTRITLARDAEPNAVTAGHYLNLPETSFLIRRLPPFLKNRNPRLAKSPKMYFTDSERAAHLAGMATLEAGRSWAEGGVRDGVPARGSFAHVGIRQTVIAKEARRGSVNDEG